MSTHVPHLSALAMVFKLVETAQKHWRRVDSHILLSKQILAVKFPDGLEVAAGKTVLHPESAAARSMHRSGWADRRCTFGGGRLPEPARALKDGAATAQSGACMILKLVAVA